MKIAVISSDKSQRNEIAGMMEAGSHSVIPVDGGKEEMQAIAEREGPDLMLVQHMHGDSDELGQIEHVTTHFPKIAVILVSSNHTPDFLISAMRAGVREVLPLPMNPVALEAAINRIAAKLKGGETKHHGRILAFIPCKGGSGATFMATNLGYQLADNRSVLLIDLNLQFGDALSFVHDGCPASTLADVAHDIRRLDASFLAASAVKIAPNYSILAAPEDPSQAIGIAPEHVVAVLDLAVRHYDFVLLDVGRNLDTLTIQALDRAHRIFPVMQAGLPYLHNAKKLMGLFNSLGYAGEKIEFIVNRFDKRGEIGLNDMRRLLGAVSLRTVPNSYKEVNTSINHGNALAETARSGAVARNLAELALLLSPRQEESQGLFDRIFKRAQPEISIGNLQRSM